MSGEDEAGAIDDGMARRAGIIARLYAALDQKLQDIENRIERHSQADGEAMSAADCERDARTLTTLAKLYEKICELEDVPDGGADDAGIKQKDQEIDADRFRLHIAARIAFSPINFSAKNDTRITISEVRGHSAAWNSICEDR